METKVTMLCGPVAALKLKSGGRNEGEKELIGWRQGERERKMIQEGGF